MKRIISKFYQINIVILFIVILVSCSSLKQNNKVSAQNSEKQVQEAQPEWLECKTSLDCIKVKGFCKLPSVVHRKYEDDFLAFVKQSRNPIDCSRYKGINYGSITEATCDDERCKLIIP